MEVNGRVMNICFGADPANSGNRPEAVNRFNLGNLMNEASNQPRTKYDKLFNVFEQFYASLPELSDRRISDLRDSWNLAKAQYEMFLSVGESKSRIAAGLEQGLRELPLLLADVKLKNRSQVVAALSSAVRTFYPDFAAKEAKRLEEILTTGKIRGENQFYLVRHRMDELEGSGDSETQLRKLYRLVDEFEARPRR